eukprot:SAG25_NODE_10298_length_339_cov_0.754167_1_plen_76_part_01
MELSVSIRQPMHLLVLGTMAVSVRQDLMAWIVNTTWMNVEAAHASTTVRASIWSNRTIADVLQDGTGLIAKNKLTH